MVISVLARTRFDFTPSHGSRQIGRPENVDDRADTRLYSSGFLYGSASESAEMTNRDAGQRKKSRIIYCSDYCALD